MKQEAVSFSKPTLLIKGTSLGIGNLTRLPVYPAKNEIQTQEKYRDTVPEQLHMKSSRYYRRSESWQSVTVFTSITFFISFQFYYLHLVFKVLKLT